MSNYDRYNVDDLFEEGSEMPAPVRRIDVRQKGVPPFRSSPFSKGATTTMVDEYGGVHTQSFSSINEFDCNHIYNEFQYAGRCFICNRTACWKCLAECVVCGRLLCNRHKMSIQGQYYCHEHWEDRKDLDFIVNTFKLIGKIIFFPVHIFIYIFARRETRKAVKGGNK